MDFCESEFFKAAVRVQINCSSSAAQSYCFSRWNLLFWVINRAKFISGLAVFRLSLRLLQPFNDISLVCSDKALKELIRLSSSGSLDSCVAVSWISCLFKSFHCRGSVDKVSLKLSEWGILLLCAKVTTPLWLHRVKSGLTSSEWKLWVGKFSF